MNFRMSPDNLYLRFFSMDTAAAERETRRICREPTPGHAALLAVPWHGWPPGLSGPPGRGRRELVQRHCPMMSIGGPRTSRWVLTVFSARPPSPSVSQSLIACATL